MKCLGRGVFRGLTIVVLGLLVACALEPATKATVEDDPATPFHAQIGRECKVFLSTGVDQGGWSFVRGKITKAEGNWLMLTGENDEHWVRIDQIVRVDY